MKASKCKICGKEEWGHVCGSELPTTEPQKTTQKPKETFDRTAYQREYMRQRRKNKNLSI